MISVITITVAAAAWERLRAHVAEGKMCAVNT